MKKIFLDNIIEDFPIVHFDEAILTSTIIEWWSHVKDNKALSLLENTEAQQCTIHSYLLKKRKLIKTILKKKENIVAQLKSEHTAFRIRSELIIECQLNEHSLIIHEKWLQNEKPLHALDYRYDKNNNLVEILLYSKDGNLISGRRVFDYDDNNNLVKYCHFGDRDFGAGPVYLIEEEKFEYSEQNVLVSNYANKTYSLEELSNKQYRFTEQCKNKSNGTTDTKVKLYNEHGEILEDKPTWKYIRKLNERNDIVELKACNNEVLKYLMKKEIVYRTN